MRAHEWGSSRLLAWASVSPRLADGSRWSDSKPWRSGSAVADLGFRSGPEKGIREGRKVEASSSANFLAFSGPG
jgi:hypothetical protein